MMRLIGQEWYKLRHRVGTWVALFILIGIHLLVLALLANKRELFSPELFINGDYLGSTVILFTMITVTATLIASEFQYGTIRPVLYRRYYRRQVFASKLIVTFLYYAVLRLVSALITFSGTALLFGDKIDVFSKPVLEKYLAFSASDGLLLLLILSVVVLLSTLFKSNALAITIGMVSYFVGQMFALVFALMLNFAPWLKWLPVTFLIRSQNGIDASLTELTHLSSMATIMGSLLYTLLFGVLAYLSFRRRSV